MSRKDLERLDVLKKVLSKELRQIDAARLLKVSDRQVRKLTNRLRLEGPFGIVSKLIGRKGNRCKSGDFKQQVLDLLKDKYEGFGPTLAAEKLFEYEKITISKETVRVWMIESHLWVPRKKKKRVHTTRLRRPCFGELIQADGSPDRWFGPDFPEVNATVLIDDATSTITALYFSKTETLEAYYSALEEHLVQYGRPLALYTDHSAIFKSPKKAGETQMQKALNELDIESILANSPQAKGRVERANRTLQDRLKKEFKLRDINTIEQANIYAKEYVKKHNESFSKKPMSDYNAHRSLEGYDLKRILCRKEERTLNCSAIFQFNHIQYQIQGVSEYRRLNRKKVEIRITRTGEMRVFLAGTEVKVLPLCEVMESNREMSRKEVIRWAPRVHKPGANHPWKQGYPKAKKMQMAV